MVICRYSLILTGEDMDLVNCENLLEGFPIHTYKKWQKDDTYPFGKKTLVYDTNGIILTHDTIYSESELSRAKIVNEYLSFLEHNISTLKSHGVTDIEMSISSYMYTKNHFVLLTKQEMKRLIPYNVIIRHEIFLLNKGDYSKIVEDMNKERFAYENVSRKKNS